jgi:hypothetical protein
MALGPNDLKQIVLPTNLDPTTLQRAALADGTSYAAVLADIGGALGIVNGSLRSGYLAGLFSETTDMTIEYAMGGTFGVEEHTEYGQPDAKRADTRSHMLPFKVYDRAMGWTRDFFRKARASQIEADIAQAMQDMRDNWERRIWQGFFTMEALAIGSLGFSLPFANGGVSDTAWIPPPYGGATFAASHDHYFRTTDDGAGRLASLTTMAETLAHHGHMAPYDLVIPSADVAAWTAVTGFIGAARAEIAFGSTTSLATVDQQYLGVFNTDHGVVRVYVLTRLPTDNAAMYKRYGNGDTRSPMVIRSDPDWEGGQIVLTAADGTVLYPLEKAILLHGFGAGTRDRTAAAFTTYAASGDYVTPVIT